jgi:predicted RNA-binding protein
MRQAIAGNKEPRCFISAFGDLATNGHKVAAAKVFEILVSRDRWYLSNRPQALGRGAHLLLYQNGKGVRAFATVEDLLEGTSEDFPLPHSLRELFTTTVVLAKTVEFDPPINLRPLVDQLRFITNKKYWGQSLRLSPREIPRLDLETILKAR